MKYLATVNYKNNPPSMSQIVNRLAHCRIVASIVCPYGNPATYLIELKEPWSELNMADIKVRSKCDSIEVYLPIGDIAKYKGAIV